MSLRSPHTRRVALLLVLVLAGAGTLASVHAAAHAAEPGAQHECGVCHLARAVPVLPAPAALPAPGVLAGAEALPDVDPHVSPASPAPHAPRAPPARPV